MFLTQRSQEGLGISLETFDCIGGRVNFREKKFRNSSNTLCQTFAAEPEEERRLLY